jgi:hypothetical protein
MPPGTGGGEPGGVCGDGEMRSAAGQPPETSGVLATGAAGRAEISRAVFRTLLAGTVFSVLTGPVKQVAALYDHAPWLNDPFDVVVSFAMFLVPLTVAYCLVRLPLCRRSEPLLLALARDLLRGCRVVLGLMTVDLLAEWASVAIGANRPQWNEATGLQVGLLALMTVLALRGAWSLLGVPPLARPIGAAADPASDWVADLVVLAARQSRRLGPLRRPVLSVLDWTDRHLLTLVRLHPLWAAAIAAAAFGAAVGGRQAIGEGYIALAAVLTIILLACGMFAFLVTAGAYLGLVRSGTQLHGVRRRALDAGVLACCGVLVVLAFRNSLWWIVGSRPAVAGIAQAYTLLGLTALGFFAVVLAVETLRNAHAGAPP